MTGVQTCALPICQVILKFAGVGSISEAEQLVGDDVMIPSAERQQLPGGMYYLGDLLGCRVINYEQEIGHVADWEDTGGGLLLHVEPIDKAAAGDEILIPFAEEICSKIDVAARVIEVRLPEGLLGLNAKEPPARRSRERNPGSGKK